MSAVSPQRLARIFVEVADTGADGSELLDFLHMLTDRAAGLVDAAAAGLLMADENGRLDFVAGSGGAVSLAELCRTPNGQGPFLDAFRSGHAVVNIDPAAAGGRWPGFAPRVAAAGFRSVHAFPLRRREEVIGALSIFGTSADEMFHPDEIAVMQAFADLATISLLRERVIRSGAARTEQLEGALHSRIVIEQAKGVIAQRYGVSVDEAFVAIRAYARRNNRRLTDVARLIVTDPAGLPGLAKV